MIVVGALELWRTVGGGQWGRQWRAVVVPVVAAVACNRRGSEQPVLSRLFPHIVVDSAQQVSRAAFPLPSPPPHVHTGV